MERARAVQPSFQLTDATAQAIAEIRHRLDGLPLAIELAAARLRHLPPWALLARLERPLSLLTGGARDLPARQQTLRAAIAWSYDLLDPPARALFRRLAVFTGGGSLQAIEEIRAAPARAEPSDAPRTDHDPPAVDTLATLVDQSLIHHVELARQAALRDA